MFNKKYSCHTVFLVFSHKPHIRQISSYLMMALCRGEVVEIHPEASINACTTFHDSVHPVLDISLKTTNMNLVVGFEEKSGDHQSQHVNSFSGDHECLCMAW